MSSQSMTFEHSPLWPEVQSIISGPSKKILYDYKGTLHTEKEDLAIWDFNSIEVVRDYLNNIGETATVVFRMGMGDYVNRLFPYRQNLEFTIKRTALEEGGSNRAKDEPVQVMRYKAIFNTSRNPPVGGSELETYHAEDLNVSDMVEIHLELVDRALEPLRIKTTGGAFANVKPGDLIRSLLAGESSKVLVDGKPAAQGMDLVEPDNKEPIPNAIIPHGLKVTSVPTFIQHQLSGVYNRGIGTYFQTYEGKKLWFVYPTYDTERFDGKDKKMVFYAVPQEKLPQLDKSYMKEGNVIKVAVTAQRRYTDSAELDYMNEGSGYRMPDARAYMKKPVKITENGPQASRAELNHEVIIKERSDGLNYAPIAQGGPSSNPFVERSKVIQRSMAQIDLVWENSDPLLIYPGMPCKYIYLSQGKAISLKGTILFVHSFSAKVEKYNASAFRMTCRVSIACEAQTKRPDLPVKGAVGD